LVANVVGGRDVGGYEVVGPAEVWGEGGGEARVEGFCEVYGCGAEGMLGVGGEGLRDEWVGLDVLC